MTWEEFASRVRTDQIGFMGEPNEVSFMRTQHPAYARSPKQRPGRFSFLIVEIKVARKIAQITTRVM